MASDESPGRCPRCRHGRTAPSGLGPAAACARCGLLETRWAEFEAPPESPALVAAWRACEADWSDPGRHDALLEMALRPEGPGGQCQLAALARRYHERTGDAIAAARLGQIRTLLETAARAEMGPPDAPLGRTTPRMFGTATHVAALVLLGAALWFLWRAGSGLVSSGPLY